jgi:glucose-1-phosphate thymidylyltransferase
MAGFGTRMRPHTWSRPKPLLPLAGKPILGHILEHFRDAPIDEYVFIVGWLGEQVKAYVRATYDIPAHFVEQRELLGQAHAFWCAREYLEGPAFTLFVDTLFDGADFSGLGLPSRRGGDAFDGVVFTKEEDDPRRFGVVETNTEGYATRLIEKPESVENKTVMIGLYYFQDSAWLARACEALIEQDIQTKGEYYLSDTVTLMIKQGAKFVTREVDVWQDTGKPETTLETHQYILNHGYDNSPEASRPAVVIIPPVYVHPEATVERSVIGPYVSIHKDARVQDSIVRHAIVDEGSKVEAALLEDSIVGRWVEAKGHFRRLNIGDSSVDDLG